MKKYKVIILRSELKSYSWNDGLFAVYKKENGLLQLWKIIDGKLSRFEDGTPSITITGEGNKGIFPTNMTITE